jgi:hypothetical protein
LSRPQGRAETPGAAAGSEPHWLPAVTEGDRQQVALLAIVLAVAAIR